jgi:hypothetical protein
MTGEHHGDAAQPTAEHGRRARVRIAVAVAGVVLVATVAMAINQAGRAQQMQDERDAAEQSAWDNRTELNQVLADTLTHLGLTGEAKDLPGSPMACVRNDGRRGLSYHLHEIDADPVPDVDALLSAAEEYWTNLGYDVGRHDMGDTAVIDAQTAAGATLELISGPGATIASGETHCALTDGRPGTG